MFLLNKKALLSLFCIASLALTGCDKQNRSSKIVFGVCADYPPFEFYHNQELQGFDIELAKILAQEMGKKAKFENMNFSCILAALQTGTIDAAISTITISAERKKNFDFSESYYAESLSILYPDSKPITTLEHLKYKKIACQLGTTMELWLKSHALDTQVVLVNSNNEAVEALKAGHVEGVCIDSVQALAFSKKNKGLSYHFIAQSDQGYGIAVKKGSSLKSDIDKALEALQARGTIEALKKKWLESESWSNL